MHRHGLEGEKYRTKEPDNEVSCLFFINTFPAPFKKILELTNQKAKRDGLYPFPGGHLSCRDRPLGLLRRLRRCRPRHCLLRCRLFRRRPLRRRPFRRRLLFCYGFLYRRSQGRFWLGRLLRRRPLRRRPLRRRPFRRRLLFCYGFLYRRSTGRFWLSHLLLRPLHPWLLTFFPLHIPILYHYCGYDSGSP